MAFETVTGYCWPHSVGPGGSVDLHLSSAGGRPVSVEVARVGWARDVVWTGTVAAGDHAAGWETSHVLALHPQTVDQSLLPPKGEPLVGVGGWMPPQDATAEFGRETFAAAADIIVREVQHRLAHPQLYRGHGNSLREGLWRE